MTRSISSRNCSRRVRFFASYSRSAKVRCFIVRSQNSVALLCHRIAGLDQSFPSGSGGGEPWSRNDVTRPIVFDHVDPSRRSHPLNGFLCLLAPLITLARL